MKNIINKIFGKKNEEVVLIHKYGCIPSKPDDRDYYWEPETNRTYQRHYIDGDN